MVDPRLYIQTIGFLLGAIFEILLGIFVIIKNPRRPLNLIFFLMNISVATFQISHAIGINIKDPNISRDFFMFNLSNLFIATFLAHWVFIVIDKAKEFKNSLIVIYATAVVLFLFYLIFPNTFLLPSVPKLYMPSYYNPGRLMWVMYVIFDAILPLFVAYHLVKAYIKSKTDPIQRNRLKYVFLGVTYGFCIGDLAIVPIFGAPIDPVWAVFFSLYTVGLAYAIINYAMLDIKIVARGAAIYSFIVIILVALMGSISFLIDLIQSVYPNFPPYAVFIISSVFATGIGMFVWNKMRQSDTLKYDFIKIMTHKFRTPLTEIKWAGQELANDIDEETRKKLGLQIGKATTTLVELVDSLVVFEKNEDYLYNLRPNRLDTLLKTLVNYFEKTAEAKGVHLAANINDEVYVALDNSKLRFLFEVLLDNAIKYTPKEGNVTVKLTKEKNKVFVEVSDTGIGIPRKEQKMVLSHFYRAQNAMAVDTEGLGTGLHLSSLIALRHGGKITFKSGGENKGTTFIVTLPIVSMAAK
jgi:signal transduction histidine kinase